MKSSASESSRGRFIYNIARERPEGSAEAVGGVTQRKLRVGLDDLIIFDEFTKVLHGAKNGKATPNQVPIEVLEATTADIAAVGLLFSYNSLPPPEPQPPPESETQRKEEGGNQETERAHCRRQIPRMAMPVAISSLLQRKDTRGH